jgi:hypothetical protein
MSVNINIPGLNKIQQTLNSVDDVKNIANQILLQNLNGNNNNG